MTTPAPRDAADKQRIVTALNRRYGTSLPIEVLELAIAYGFTTWDQLAAEERSLPMR